jgi:hypothetical protein
MTGAGTPVEGTDYLVFVSGAGGGCVAVVSPGDGVRDPGELVRAPGQAVHDPGELVCAPAWAVRIPGELGGDRRGFGAIPGGLVSTPAEPVSDRGEPVSDPGVSGGTPGRVVRDPGRLVAIRGGFGGIPGVFAPARRQRCAGRDWQENGAKPRLASSRRFGATRLLLISWWRYWLFGWAPWRAAWVRARPRLGCGGGSGW